MCNSLGHQIDGGLNLDDSDVVLKVPGVEVRVGVEADHVGVEVRVEFTLPTHVPLTHTDLELSRRESAKEVSERVRRERGRSEEREKGKGRNVKEKEQGMDQ